MTIGCGTSQETYNIHIYIQVQFELLHLLWVRTVSVLFMVFNKEDFIKIQ
jgi:hypothetical protein